MKVVYYYMVKKMARFGAVFALFAFEIGPS